MLKLLQIAVLIVSLVGCANDEDGFIPNPLSSLSVLPNPTTDDIIVSFDLARPTPVQVLIFNRWGKAIHLVNSDYISEGQHHFHFSVLKEPSGTYFVQVATELATLKGHFQKVE